MTAGDVGTQVTQKWEKTVTNTHSTHTLEIIILTFLHSLNSS